MLAIGGKTEVNVAHHASRDGIALESPQVYTCNKSCI